MRAGDRLHRHRGAPQIERVTRVPDKFRVLWLNSGVKAIIAMDNAYEQLETIGTAQSGQVYPETNLRCARGDGGKRAYFSKIYHMPPSNRLFSRQKTRHKFPKFDAPE
jgi:hypothetical protein